MFRSFASNIVDDVKKLGKGSFGTVILGYWKSRHIFKLLIKVTSEVVSGQN